MINLKKISYGPLADGQHTVKVHDWTLVEDSTTPDKSYVRIDLELLEQPGRIINDNRFEKGLDIAVSQLRKQLEIPADVQIPVDEFLNSLTKNSTILKVWLSTTISDKDPNTSYRNYNYLPPLPKPVANSATTAAPELETPDVM